jgi:sugar (pentulose or hexulose) kinase
MTLPLLGLDIGTTHCKAGLFEPDGRLIAAASRWMVVKRDPDGSQWFDPEQVWQQSTAAARQVLGQAGARWVGAVGVASMAESGLLVDPASGRPYSALLPWFDPSATPQAEQLRAAGDPLERFLKTGLRPNFKSSLAKILWLREKEGALPEGALWLSAADYIAYRLTGCLATDASLAGRTYAFDLERRAWDSAWLERFGLGDSLFPPILPSGAPLGEVLPGAGEQIRLAPGAPVAVCGHDHVVAAFAAGAVEPGLVFDSMGTAEALLGALPARPLGEAEFRSGLVFGPHVVPRRNYWMGGLSASGGSLEWLRSLLGEPALDYRQLQALLEEAAPGPTGILYFPYLAGSGSPHTDLHVRAAFVGLDARHGRAELLKALLEGTAYEAEFIRRAAQPIAGLPIERLTMSGGGARNPAWLQIKADVSGCRLEAPVMPEATLLGAALLAGVGAGLFPDHRAALAGLAQSETRVYLPDADSHFAYQQFFEQGFLALQAPLREVARALSELNQAERASRLATVSDGHG